VKKVLLVLLMLAALMALISTCAWSQGRVEEVSSEDLIERMDEYDGREVIFRGEAVGDVMVRGDYAWITVNDDHYSREALHEAGKLRGGNSGIGIWLPAAEAEQVTVVGRYGTVGDYVEVRGVFNADCVEHGGDVDIHATFLEVLEPGRQLDISPGWELYVAAALSIIFVLATMTPFLRRRTRDMRSARALMRDGEE
jgi:hypothetical protein